MNLPTPIRTTALVLVAALGTAACQPQTNGSAYQAGHVMTASQVQYGTIVDARAVELRHVAQGDGTAGMLLGGALGALAGNQIGDGTGQTLATGAGAIAGAALGTRTAQRANRHQATEWTVRLDNGATIAVVQDDPTLRVGASVKVVTNASSTRLVR